MSRLSFDCLGFGAYPRFRLGVQDESVGQGKTRLFAQVRPRSAQPALSLCPGVLKQGGRSQQTSILIGIERMTKHVMLYPLSLFAFEMQQYLAQVSLIIFIGVCRA